MSRRPRGTRKPKHYDCFICGEKFDSNFMPIAICLGHEICWTCKEKHKAYDRLCVVIKSKEDELRESENNGGTA